jgi:putative membrane protein
VQSRLTWVKFMHMSVAWTNVIAHSAGSISLADSSQPRSSPLLLISGESIADNGFLNGWASEPSALLLLLIAGLLYAFGVRRLWRSVGMGQGIRRWELLAFGCGWIALVIALVSPLHPLGRELLSLHIAQHEVLILIAAPLMVLGRPGLGLNWSFPIRIRQSIAELTRSAAWQSVWRRMTRPLVACTIQAVALWVWHVLALFQATLANETVHAAQHLSFFFSAALFWWSLLHARRGPATYGTGVLYLFLTSIHSGILSALIAFADSVWYPAYSNTTQSWGLTPLEDQQLGGLIMWIPAGLVYLFAALALVIGWLREAGSTATIDFMRHDRVVGSISDRIIGRL